MDRQDKGWPGEVRRAVIGLFVAFGIVSLFAVVVFYLLPGLLGAPGLNWSSLGSESVEIFYLEEDFPDFDAKSYLSEVVREKRNIVKELNIGENEVPNRIRVYLHEDLSALRAAILERKNSSDMEVPLAIIDVLAGHEVKPVMVRLLTYFSWGQPASEFLRLGLQAHFSSQIENPHLRVAGLGDEMFSFPEIDSLSRTDNIPRTLHDKIYDSFDSPYASAGMNLSDFSSLMRSGAGESPYRYELEAEAASFVSYLLDKYGPDRFRTLWRSDDWLKDMEGVYRVPPKELEEAWHDIVRQRGEKSPRYWFYRARTLYSRGSLERALTLLENHPEGEAITAEGIFLRAKIHFYMGEWSNARIYFSKLQAREIDPDMSVKINAYTDLLRTFERGSREETKGLKIFKSEGAGDLEQIFNECTYVVQKAERELPEIAEKLEPLIIFVDGEVSGRDTREQLEHPNWVAFGPGSKNFSLEAAELVADRISRTPTYSNLLRRGLIHYMVSPDAFELAKEIVIGGTWEPLSSVTVGLDTESTSSAQAAAFVGYILSNYGPDKFNRIWYLTTPLGGDNSLETALVEVVSKGLRGVETSLKDFLKNYEE